MKINKWIPVVSAINIALLGLAIYVLGLTKTACCPPVGRNIKNSHFFL